MAENLLNELFRRHGVWKGNRMPATGGGIGTGFAALDRMLPCRGWPRGTVMEITVADWGIGELSLFLPLMSHYQQIQRYVTWINPPHAPYPPALAAGGLDPGLCRVLLNPQKSQQVLWCAEKLLQSSACGLVMAWPRRLSGRSVRRLQLAVEDSEALCILWRKMDQVHAWDGSPAAMRLYLSRTTRGLKLEIHKARGTCRHTELVLDI